MNDRPSVRVLINQRLLKRAAQAGDMQCVATVYVNGNEFRILAPPGAQGRALDWVPHFSVRRLSDANAEAEVHDGSEIQVMEAVRKELEKRETDGAVVDWVHPDGVHSVAQVCFKGHLVHCDGMPFCEDEHCTKCGAPCIHNCPECAEPIRGGSIYDSADRYIRPDFCHACGAPYPWTAERLDTARKLLDHEGKLSPEDRRELWDCLQYVITDPSAELVPAKKRLIEFKLEKVTGPVREFVLDLVARTTAEIFKSKAGG